MQKNERIWLWILVATLAFSVVPLQAPAEDEPLLKEVVAVVNESSITLERFNAAMLRADEDSRGTAAQIDASQRSEIEKEVLEKLIDQELLYQESLKKGFTVDPSEVGELLQQMRSRFPEESEFNKALGKMGVYGADVEPQVKRWMETRRFVEEEFVRNVTITEAEIKAYYDGHTRFFWQPECVRVSHILIRVNAGADETQRTEARQKIEAIRMNITGGEDFAKLATAQSQCPSAAGGGDLGYIKRGEMVQPFDTAAFALAPGEVSGIVETRFGYHIIKSVDKKPDTIIFYENARDRIERHLKNEAVQRLVNQYVEELKKSARIERFPTKVS